jgi:hypothetical protein
MDRSLLLSLLSGTFIAGAAAYLGSLMLSRRMALVAGPLGHLTLPGIALALVWGFDVSLGAFPFVVLGVFLIWLLQMRTKLPTEALTALVFASGVAIAFLFLPVDQAEAALVGDISKAGTRDTALSVMASLLVVFAVNRGYSELVLSNVSEELAVSEGINVKRYNLLYLSLVDRDRRRARCEGGRCLADRSARRDPAVCRAQPWQEPHAIRGRCDRHRRRVGRRWDRAVPGDQLCGWTAHHPGEHRDLPADIALRQMSGARTAGSRRADLRRTACARPHPRGPA